MKKVVERVVVWAVVWAVSKLGTKIPTFFYIFFIILYASLSQSIYAKDNPTLLSNASASMLANACSGCHGPSGASLGPSIPTISGMSKKFFIRQMNGYKDKTVPSTIMSRIATGYTFQEIKIMAEYFSNKQFVIAKDQKSNPVLAEKGAKLHQKYCEKCHSLDGTSAQDHAGILSGQWRAYLEASLQDYIFGNRKAPKKMARRIRKVMRKEGLDGFKALIEFYAR